jgi:hypothetical protein
LNVSKRATSTGVSVSSPVLAGQPGSVTVTVTDVEASGAKSSPAGTVTLSSSTAGDAWTPAAACTLAAGASGVSTCTASVSGTAVGARTISATYPGSVAHLTSGGTASLTIRGNTVTTITGDSPSPSGLGQSVTVSYTVVAASPATGGPTGTVTVSDGSGNSCSAILPVLSCSFVPAGGSVTLTASYAGDTLFNPSSGTRVHSVLLPYTFTGFLSPLSPAGTLTAPSNSGSGNFSKGLPLKWQIKDSAGNFLSSLTTTQNLYAAYYGAVCGTGQATGATSVLYQPTTGATGGSTFRYDNSNNQFLFNWATSKLTTGAGCYEVILQLNDGSAPKATKILLQ